MPAIVCVENLEWNRVFNECLVHPMIIENSCDASELNEKIPPIEELFNKLKDGEGIDCYDCMGIYFALNGLGRILVGVDLDEDTLITPISISHLKKFIEKCQFIKRKK